MVDARLGPVLGRLGVQQLGRAAGRVAAELDAASWWPRMEAAVRSRRVSVRPAPDGMAYLSVLGPLRDVVGAHAALVARSRGVVGGQCPEEAPEGRGVGAVAADTALRLLSGRAWGEVQPVEVHLVMTDRALLGTGDTDRSVFEPARIPGHGSVPAPVARQWVREAGEGSVWLRRLYTSPSGRDLVAMDSRRRVFSGLLRRMLVLRDDVCVTPWCGAPVVHADHAVPVRRGGVTSWGNGDGRCVAVQPRQGGPGLVGERGRLRPAAAGTGRPGGSLASGRWVCASRPVVDGHAVGGCPVGAAAAGEGADPDRARVRLVPAAAARLGLRGPGGGEPAVRVTDLGSRGALRLGPGRTGQRRATQRAHGAAQPGRRYRQASGAPPTNPARGSRRGATTPAEEPARTAALPLPR